MFRDLEAILPALVDRALGCAHDLAEPADQVVLVRLEAEALEAAGLQE
jgi:hypothetical protein